jgi:hypothetical protein
MAKIEYLGPLEEEQDIEYLGPLDENKIEYLGPLEEKKEEAKKIKVIPYPSISQKPSLPFEAKHPYLVGAGRTVLNLIPFARFLDPETRQEFYQKSLESPMAATGEMLLQDVLPLIPLSGIAGALAAKPLEQTLKFIPRFGKPSLAEQAVKGVGKVGIGQAASELVERKALPPASVERKFIGQEPLIEKRIIVGQEEGLPIEKRVFIRQEGRPLIERPLLPKEEIIRPPIKEETIKGKPIRIKEEGIKTDAQKVQQMYEKADKELEKAKKLTAKKIYREVKRQVVDVSGNIKNELFKLGDEGKKVVIRHDLIAGANSKAIAKAEEAFKNIYSDLTPEEHKLLDRVIQSRRIIDIESYKPEVKHPGGLGAKEHLAYLESLPQGIKEKLNEKASLYFAEMRKQLKELYDNGLLTREQYNALAKHEYEPRKFIQYIDPKETGYTFSGKKISVPSSGIQPLKEGSERALENDSQLLLNQVIARTQARIARNNANKALYELAVKNPDNGIVKLAPKGKTPAGYDKISVMINGQKKEMIMPKSK